MNKSDIKGLRYYIAFCAMVIGFFVYAGITGWLWFNPTKAEPVRTTRPGHVYRYHK